MLLALVKKSSYSNPIYIKLGVTMNFEQARFNMIEQQIRPWSVLDTTVLQTMGDIPRDIFVPDALVSMAYADIEIPIGHDETMMFPRVEGRMLQELEIGIDDECLEIGTGSGFATACMATMANHVDSVDIHDDFLESAARRFEEVNISNIQLSNQDALLMDNTSKQYDAIAVTSSLPEYVPLFEQLLKHNVRLFIVVGSGEALHALKIVRKDDSFIRQSLFETKLKKMVGIKEITKFSF
jgi:protein-L-isoaspartate(D-aspartate) O-methyltransferase